MADRKLPVSGPNSKKIKIEVQGDRSETSGNCFSPSGFQSFTYADLLYYVSIDKEGKIFNYSDLLKGGADNEYCTVCKVPGHGTNVCLRPYIKDWPGFPINGIAILQRPIWMPPLYRPQVATLRDYCATVRRQRRATIRRQHMQMRRRLHMPVHVHSLQRPFIVPAPSIYRVRTVGRRDQPHCSLCGAIGHDICTCSKLA
ncbi:PREDICTED: uncharacterized protein LOC101302791 [Fragaria vesca subsp. vesca]|uniref:uncharacterized protein LOC101302791 n=1 Tax=Fragaria vesca subsp. vesca TaxID=101020 RepID=UPI0002C30160|nr:PREDICTED: uncharacterized protein LOC101302791 [Fragaria vesca subsp. vesca]